VVLADERSSWPPHIRLRVATLDNVEAAERERRESQIFNALPVKELMVHWPSRNQLVSSHRNYWQVVLPSTTTALDLFRRSNKLVLSSHTYTGKQQKEDTNFDSDFFSTLASPQNGAVRRMAINWNDNDQGGSRYSVRLGYSWTASNRQSNQIVSGLGLKTSNSEAHDIGWSGDYISCCGTPAPHGNTSASFQLFGRYMTASCEFTKPSPQSTVVARQKSSSVDSPYLSLEGGHLSLSDVAHLNQYTMEYWFRLDESNWRDPVLTFLDIGGQRV
jgi:hypothetical protein